MLDTFEVLLLKTQTESQVFRSNFGIIKKIQGEIVHQLKDTSLRSSQSNLGCELWHRTTGPDFLVEKQKCMGRSQL